MIRYTPPMRSMACWKRLFAVGAQGLARLLSASGINRLLDPVVFQTVICQPPLVRNHFDPDPFVGNPETAVRRNRMQTSLSPIRFLVLLWG